MSRRANTKKKDIRTSQLMKQIVNSCADAKGRDIVILDVSNSFSVASYFIIVSGRSDRQVQGISNRIVNDLENIGYKPFSINGLDQGHWVLLDCDDVIVHVFYEPLREHYNLEGLWASAKRLKLEKYLNVHRAAA